MNKIDEESIKDLPFMGIENTLINAAFIIKCRVETLEKIQRLLKEFPNVKLVCHTQSFGRLRIKKEDVEKSD